MKELNKFLILLSLCAFGLVACGGQPAEICNLTQDITAMDPDGDTKDLSDISEAESGQASTDCPRDLLNPDALNGKVGPVEFTQTDSMGTIFLVIKLEGIWPFAIPIEFLEGERTEMDFTSITPPFVTNVPKFCHITGGFSGTIDPSAGKIEGTLGATVFNISNCREEL